MFNVIQIDNKIDNKKLIQIDNKKLPGDSFPHFAIHLGIPLPTI